NPDVDAGAQEVDRTVGEHDVGAARVEAVDLPLVNAVDGTRTPARRSVELSSLKSNKGNRCGPGAGRIRRARDVLASLPALGPAGTFPDQSGVGRTVGDFGYARHIVMSQNAGVVSQCVDQPEIDWDFSDPDGGGIIRAGTHGAGSRGVATAHSVGLCRGT